MRRDLRELWRQNSRVPGYTGEHRPHLLTMGRGSYGDPTVLCVFGECAPVQIGNYCSIADGVTFLLGGGHRLDTVTTAPVILGEIIPGHPAGAGGVTIGHDVWVGRGATILEGVTIGSGAVIGAHSLVTKDIAPYEIAVGNPARVVRRRFSTEVCDQLLASEWWNWPDERIAAARPLLWSSDIDAFLRLA